MYLRQRTQISFTVYELRPEPTTLGGAIALMPNGLRLFDRLGVHDRLLTKGNSCSSVILHSLQGSVLGEIDRVAAAKEEMGFGYLRIIRSEFLDVLLEAARNDGIEVQYSKRLKSITDDGNSVTVEFGDGTTDTADFLLGCDGIHSSVRRLYVDPNINPEYTGVSILGSIIPASLLGESVVSQLRGTHITMTQEGMFMAMPCDPSNEKILWVFQKEVPLPKSGDDRDGWEVHRKKEVEGFKSQMLEVLRDAEGEWGAAMKRMIEQTSTVQFYPIYKLPFGGKWFRGRCLLLGDAAHAMPPHAVQGVSMALEDASLLSRLLENDQRSLDDIFSTFDKIRRDRVKEVASQAEKNAQSRKRTGPWGLWFKEMAISFAIWGYTALGKHIRNAENKFSVYDIDKEEV